MRFQTDIQYLGHSHLIPFIKIGFCSKSNSLPERQMESPHFLLSHSHDGCSNTEILSFSLGGIPTFLLQSTFFAYQRLVKGPCRCTQEASSRSAAKDTERSRSCASEAAFSQVKRFGSTASTGRSGASAACRNPGIWPSGGFLKCLGTPKSIQNPNHPFTDGFSIRNPYQPSIFHEINHLVG